MTTDSDHPDPPSDAEAFSAFFDANFTDVWNYLRRRVAISADADDLAAEVFSVAWRRRHELPPPEEQRLWLFGVARNNLRNHQRSTTRQLRLVGRLQDYSTDHDAVEPIQRDDALWHALAELNADDRDLLLMRAWDQLSVTDIAVLLECTTNAVSLRLHKARHRLKAELDKLTPPGDLDLSSEKDPKPNGNEALESTPKGDAR